MALVSESNPERAQELIRLVVNGEISGANFRRLVDEFAIQNISLKPNVTMVEQTLDSLQLVNGTLSGFVIYKKTPVFDSNSITPVPDSEMVTDFSLRKKSPSGI